MRTNIKDTLSRLLGSENRRKVVKAILDRPGIWSYPELEKVTRVPHATVWRTVLDMERAKILKSKLIGRRTKIFSLVEDSPYISLLRSVINLVDVEALSLESRRGL
jgi:predicted transcriptional regulator